MAREMKDSGIEWIGEIPTNWQCRKVKTILIANDGGVWGSDPTGNETDKIVIRSTEQTIDGKWCIQSPAIRDLNSIDYSKSRILKNDLLITKSSGSDSHIGKTTLADEYFDQHECYYSNFLQRIRCSGYSPKLLWYLFNSQIIRSQCVYLQNSTSGLGNINAEIIRNIYIPIPSNPEQTSITAFLDIQCAHIDAVIEQTRASIEEYKKLKQAVITQAVTKGIRPDREMKDSGIEWIGEIPADWQLCKLRHIGSAQNGISKGGEFFGEGFPFISYGDVYRNYALPYEVTGLIQSTEEEQKLYSVEKGDIFFTRTSETIEEVGFSSVCLETIPNATFAGFLIRIRPYDDALDTDFAKFYFRSSHHRFYLVKQMNLVTRASLGQPLLKGMPVLIPNKKEQLEIASYLDYKCNGIDSIIEKKEMLTSELEQYKKSLIFEYVTGKKEVPA